MGSLTYIEKLMEEMVSQLGTLNEKIDILLVKSFPELAAKPEKGTK